MQGPMLHLTWLALVAVAHAAGTNSPGLSATTPDLSVSTHGDFHDVNRSSSTEISPLLDGGLPKPSPSLTIMRSAQVNSTEPLRPNANNSHASEQPQAQEDFIHSTKALRVVTSSAVSDVNQSSSTGISPLLDGGLPKPSPSLTILRSAQVNSTEPLRPNANNSHASEQPQAQEDFIQSTKALRVVTSSAVSGGCSGRGCGECPSPPPQGQLSCHDSGVGIIDLRDHQKCFQSPSPERLCHRVALLPLWGVRQQQ
ncbi:uncharacterized protein LOC133358596 [Lethenteron reissneri]|uniref:uncharacterized protein LOC133358596 n=1 Tax=Lethenteron reissneri TaxID=7753 RepID=UPI002AB66A08|nr:uncharacterized protein LOC133358596 [Lethenteron reissneri]